CAPSAPSDCGVPIFWPGGCVSYDLNDRGSRQVTIAETESVLADAFATWASVDCGGGAHPSFAVMYLGPVACDRHEYNPQAGNANIVLYHDDDWPYESEKLAVTSVHFDADTGALYDADIEINAADHDLTLGDNHVEDDLASILQ